MAVRCATPFLTSNSEVHYECARPSDREVLRTLIDLKLRHCETLTWHELANETQLYMSDLMAAMNRLQAAGYVSFDATQPRSFLVTKLLSRRQASVVRRNR